MPKKANLIEALGISEVKGTKAYLCFGMSEEQFMRMLLHPAYSDSAMPPEHAAAAAAYLVVRLASEYHGEQVSGYAVLERAGFIPSRVVGGAGFSTARGYSESSQAARSEKIHEMAALIESLVSLLKEMSVEFSQLPVFVRPMARAGFKNKSGQSLQDWEHNCQTEIKTAV